MLSMRCQEEMMGDPVRFDFEAVCSKVRTKLGSGIVSGDGEGCHATFDGCVPVNERLKARVAAAGMERGRWCVGCWARKPENSSERLVFF